MNNNELSSFAPEAKLQKGSFRNSSLFIISCLVMKSGHGTEQDKVTG